jgi:hypothetical protein
VERVQTRAAAVPQEQVRRARTQLGIPVVSVVHYLVETGGMVPPVRAMHTVGVARARRDSLQLLEMVPMERSG